MKPANVRQFFQQFPDDDACLAHLFNVRFGQGHVCPKCEREARWYPIKAEKAFSCQWCGHHIHPMVDTIFEKSRTPLQLWFYVMFLFTTTRHGVSGKEIQRQTGVTYKTAYRMGTLIRRCQRRLETGPLGRLKTGPPLVEQASACGDPMYLERALACGGGGYAGSLSFRAGPMMPALRLSLRR